MSDIEVEVFQGDLVLGELGRLREEFQQTNLYPVVLGDEDDCDHIQDCLEAGVEEGWTQDSIVRASRVIDPEKWLKEAIQRATAEVPVTAGEWPTEPVEPTEFVTHLDLGTGEAKDEVGIALFPLREPWEVFAALCWGAWNECPDPAEHCAVHRYWHEKYGAEVVSVTGDVVQCWVARPPQTPEEAIQLAWQHFGYCRDIVTQGTETIAALAAALLDAEFWYFWWD